MRGKCAFGALRKHVDAKAEHQVFKNLQIAFDRLAAHFGVARNIRKVQDGTMSETHRFQEARKSSDVAHKAFHL